MAEKNVTLKDTKTGEKLYPETRAKLVITASGKDVEEFLASLKTYGQATSTTLGLVKIGYTESGKNYPVELDSSGKMFVNVPWTDTNTTYSVFKAATASAAGGTGLVPAPAAGKQLSFLRGDGTWVVPTNTTYNLVGAKDSTGLVKNGSTVTNASGYTACPIIGGIPYYKDTNTTYSKATTSNDGLMSKEDKAKVDKAIISEEITTVKKTTQFIYDNLETKDSNTLYVIVG